MAETPTAPDVFEAYVRLRENLAAGDSDTPGFAIVVAPDLRAVLQTPWDYATDERTLQRAIDAFNVVMAENTHPHLNRPILHRTHPNHLQAMRAAITTLLGGDKK